MGDAQSMWKQYKDLVRAEAESYRRLKRIFLLVEETTVYQDQLNREMDWSLLPKREYEAKYVRFSDQRWIGWPVSIVDFLIQMPFRILLIPMVGVQPRWPQLRVPKEHRRG